MKEEKQKEPICSDGFQEEKPLVNKDESIRKLNENWNQIDDILKIEEGDIKEIANTLSAFFHELVDILVNLSNDKDYENIACGFCKENHLFNKIYNWTGQHRECLRVMAHQQLLIYKKILEHSSLTLLSCNEVLFPLLLLLMSLKPTDKRKVPSDIERLYITILYHVAQRICSLELLDLLSQDLFTPDGFKIPKFTFFELLTLYTHHPGENGDLARQATLDSIKISERHEAFQRYIIEESSVSVIIAGGLSARYSSLPTTLEIHTEEWHYITESDLVEMSEVQTFLQALDFCCQVIQASNLQVRLHLAKLIYDGFLMSVLAPALNQTYHKLKSYGSLLESLMTDAYDNKALITLLIYHINSKSVQLSMVAIHLFKTLLELNCEDIIFHLVFRYLLPCDHILPNQKRTIKSVDYYCKSATMFLYLTPSSCIETLNNSYHDSNKTGIVESNHNVKSEIGSPRSIRSFGSPSLERKTSMDSVKSYSSNTSITPDLKPHEALDFLEYLTDARQAIGSCKRCCHCWSAVYDGMDVVTDSSRIGRLSSSSSRQRTSEGSPVSFQRTLSKSSDSAFEDHNKSQALYTTEILGPFLNAIFDKLEVMMENSVYVNLLLTSLISRLACYPQPLLRSFLLNANLVIRPGVRSLAQVLKKVSDGADLFLSRLDDYKVLITKARQNLLDRKESVPCTETSGQSEQQFAVSLDPTTGQTKFQRTEVNKPITPDDLISLNNPTSMVRSVLVSVNTSLINKDSGELERRETISNTGNVGRLHPALPKIGFKSPSKRSKNFPSKKEIDELRQKNPTIVKNAVYCALVLEEFMKELAAISIEQTMQ